MEDRVATGIGGFDRLVAGGFPRGTVNLLAGPAGSGKSLFGLHFVYNGAAQQGEPGLYLVLEENRDGIERALATYGMDLAAVERDGRMLLVDLGGLRVDDPRGVVGFPHLQDFLAAALPKTGAKRLVVDSLSAIGLHFSASSDSESVPFSLSKRARSSFI